MKEIRTNCGTEYKNKLNEEICRMCQIKHSFTVPYRHESVGTVERNHRFFNQYFRAFIENTSQWEEYLSYFTFCYNTSPHSSFSDKYSLYQLVFNKDPNVPEDLVREISPIYNVDNFANEAKYRLQVAHEEARKLLIKSKEANKRLYDKRSREANLSIGDKVYIEALPYNKHKNVNQGPFTIISIDEPNVTIVDKNNNTKKVHSNQIRF